ncbi:MAG TPA: Fic family protein [Stellaceae bacterium]|nr:Fic family protein [Stellaceae bacterium]
MNFIWEEEVWPGFTWDAATLLVPLAQARMKQGKLLGSMARLGFDLRQGAELEALTEEIIKSSEIEGETLSEVNIRSSIAWRLGMEAVPPEDRRSEGVVAIALDAATHFALPLTEERLCGWHAALFPSGYSSIAKIKVGGWREDRAGPMRVVSGPIGRERVHYVAPPAERVGREMARFFNWYNGAEANDGLIRAGLAHLWFVAIHPFDDGNGRIGRAIVEHALARDEGIGQRFYGISAEIRRQRQGYYDALERAGRGGLEVTAWLRWFLECYGRAIDAAEETLAETHRRAEFWQHHAKEAFNPRQKAILVRLLDRFEGNLTARKWALLGKCSIDTAQRDIQDLVARDILLRNPGGSKNTSYRLRLSST